ncbi:MAG: hypothetical protein H7336_03360 [Bacteriovorax sp.]|nr:hypothetical protein [Bacteriovorax sp.]
MKINQEINQEKNQEDLMIINNLALGSITLLALLSGCAGHATRGLSSENNDGLSSIIDQIGKASRTQTLTSQSCKTTYNELYEKLFNLAGDTAYLDLNDTGKMDQDIRDSFNARIALKNSFKSFSPDNDCFKSASDVFRGLRYVEDYLIGLRMDRTQSGPAEYVNLKGEFPYLLVNPKYAEDFKSYEDLKSGDIILSRGNAFSSAAIARIGLNDYQFSHLSFVYKDPEKAEIMTTEAHIEIGSVAEPIESHLASKNSREVVFRYSDAAVAHTASKYIYTKVLAAQNTGHNIEYDFTMDFKDEHKLFCSEIISHGFKHALPDEDYFPMFKSKFSPGIIPFLNTIGVPANKENIGSLEVFAPEDIQFDPRFEMVAEWRNPKKMEESRLKDFILTKMFERMDQESYVIDPSFKMSAETKTLWLLRRLPVVKKFLSNKFSLTMNINQMELFMAIDKIGDAVYKEVEKKSLEFERPMTPKEIYVVLDDFFKQDFDTYTRYKKGQDLMKPVFHQWFHP